MASYTINIPQYEWNKLKTDKSTILRLANNAIIRKLVNGQEYMYQYIGNHYDLNGLVTIRVSPFKKINSYSNTVIYEDNGPKISYLDPCCQNDEDESIYYVYRWDRICACLCMVILIIILSIYCIYKKLN